MKSAREAAAERPLLYDGSKGVMLQRLGLAAGEASELWNLTHAPQVREVHERYAAAGADVIQTNTFPGNRVTLARHGLEDRFEELNAAGVGLARAAAGDGRWVAASIGPTGQMLEPAGDLTFDRAFELYGEQAAVLAHAGADMIHFETFTDLAELRAGILAAKEKTGLPLIATATFEANGRTLAGNSPGASVVVCEALGVAFMGANCSTGPEDMVPVLEAMARFASGPLVAKPNAGMPEIVEGSVVYRETAEHFAGFTGRFLAAGVRLIGGCCGSTPEFVAAIAKRLPVGRAAPSSGRRGPLLASAFEAVEIGAGLVVGEIGEAEARRADSQELVERAGELAAEGAGCLILDLGSADRADAEALASDFGVFVRLPLVIRCGSERLLSRFLRRYAGRPGVIGGQDAYGAAALADDSLSGCPRVGK